MFSDLIDYAKLGKHDDDCRTAVRDKGKWNTGKRQDAGNGTNVDECLKRDRRSDTYYQKPAKVIGSSFRDPETPPEK
jgi:hypothetical protein